LTIAILILINKTYWVNIWEALVTDVGSKHWDPLQEVIGYEVANSKVRVIGYLWI
jgi:hypothetical protein